MNNLTKFQKEVLARFDKLKIMLEIAERQRLYLKTLAKSHEGLLKLIMESSGPPTEINFEERDEDIQDELRDCVE